VGLKLTKAQILAMRDLPTEELEVPELGGSVTLRAWSVAGADYFAKMCAEGAMSELGHVENFRERIVMLSVVDEETGELMFSEDDISTLGKKSPAAINRIVKAVLKLNKLENDIPDGLDGAADDAPAPTPEQKRKN
jgi:hypothetical protein